MIPRPIRGLNCDMRTLDQACAELGLDPADYRAARGEAKCWSCNGTGHALYDGPLGYEECVQSKVCSTCGGTGRQPEGSAP